MNDREEGTHVLVSRFVYVHIKWTEIARVIMVARFHN